MKNSGKHSFRKYKKQMKYKYGEWWNTKWKWPGNFHPKQVKLMMTGQSFVLPGWRRIRMANIFDLTPAQHEVIAKPFVGGYRKIRTGNYTAMSDFPEEG
jgi:hypothetical protein